MRRKAPSSSPQKMSQATLTSFFSSPPSKIPVTPKVRNRKRVPTLSSESEGTESDASDVGAIQFEPEVIDLSDGDESPRRPMAKRRTRRIRADSNSADEAEIHISHSCSSQDKSRGSLRRKSRRIGKRKQVNEESGSEELRPKKRKFIKGVRPSSPEEDEDDILNEVEEHHIIESRLRTRDKKTIFQKNLERLKRKKRGLAPLESSQSSQSAGEEDEGDEDTNFFTPFPGARPDIGDGGENSSYDDPHVDDSFIVDDDDGVPAADLPVQFSMNTHQDLAHHFKIICQLFVHLAVRPVQERRSYMEHVMKNEEYFSVPLQIARRKLSGLRDSLVASSVWRSDFKNQLQKYPIFELSSLDFAIPACDACHLGGRMSTLLGRVSGLPYDKLGFEPLNESETSSSDESGQEGYETIKEFNLGRFCAKRTQVFHQFTHWEYTLYSALLLEVEELRASEGRGKRSFVRVAFAKGTRPPEDLTDADGIMDWLDQRGIIDMEWRTIRNLMESARNLEVAAKRGENDIDVS